MSVARDLLLATNNSKKLNEIRAILGADFQGRVLCAGDFGKLPEPEEIGTTFAANAQIKADYYCAATGLVTIADDSGLIVDALDGRPGVYSARYAPTDNERIMRLLEELKNVPEEQRTARFVCAMHVSVPGQTPITAEGILEGSIGFESRGNHGFGYDPVFIVKGGHETLAEVKPEIKNSISHRGQAMKKLQPDLLALFA